MSTSNNPWLQFHQNNPQPTVQTDETAVVTSPNHNPGGSSQLNRVTRPTIARRRPRASRKTPTTLLNTDTTNFRAMVQRFTGGGHSGPNVTSAPYTSHEYPVTTQVLNTYNNNTSAGFGDGVASVSSVTSDHQVLNTYNQPYFTMMGDSGRTTTTAAAYDDHNGDQHMGFRQTGSYIW